MSIESDFDSDTITLLAFECENDGHNGTLSVQRATSEGRQTIS